MRLLLLPNIYPTSTTPTGATFVRSRLRALSDHGVTVVPVAVRPSWTRAAHFTRTALARRPDEPPVEPFLSATAPLGVRHALRRQLGHRSAQQWLDQITEATLRHVPGGVDLVHAHGMYDLPAGMVARSVALRLGVPYVVSLHGTDVNRLMPRRAELYARVLAGACATIYVSGALRDQAQSLVPIHPRAHVIPNGVDPALFRPGARAEQPTVLFVGNLERVKGVDRLPEIWREVRAAVPDARLRVVGAGSLMAGLRSRLSGPSVQFLGRLDQAAVAREMAQAHVLVLPSRAEGWPTVIMESYATGTPVVGTMVGGIPEAIVDADCLVPSGPALERRFAEAVVGVLRQEAQHPRAALLDAARGHTWDQVAAREIEVYRSCLGDGGGPAMTPPGEQ